MKSITKILKEEYRNNFEEAMGKKFYFWYLDFISFCARYDIKRKLENEIN
jgi:hypothetical protein